MYNEADPARTTWELLEQARAAHAGDPVWTAWLHWLAAVEAFLDPTEAA